MTKGIPRTSALPLPISEIRAASTAGGGTALTTTAGRILLPNKTEGVVLMPRNFSTAVAVKFGFCPYLIVLKTIDDLATVTDYTDAAQDGSTSTDVDLSSLSTLANGDYLLVGSHLPFAGLVIDVDLANANAATILAQYWNGTAWTDISATDGTASGGACFAVDGNVTWTVPASWTNATLRETGLSPAAAVGQWQQPQLYWLRISVSAALDATTTFNSIISMARSTTYGELIAGALQELTCKKGPGGIAAIEALTDAGTANLIVNCYTYGEGGF